MALPPRTKPSHVHGATCESAAATVVFRCLECELLFEGGIADPGRGRGERCPQCGLVNSVPVATPDGDAFVIRHSSPFR